LMYALLEKRIVDVIVREHTENLKITVGI